MSVRLTSADVTAVAVLLLMAVAIYRPDLQRSLDYVDFPENILTLKAHDGFLAYFKALMDVYREHGRFSPVTMSLMAAQWSWFEWWAPGWYLVRFAVMGGVTSLAYVLFRKLCLARGGAFAAAALFVVSPPAVIGWTRLSTAEPVATLFLASACLLAIRSSRTANWGVALLLLLVMWTKEVVTASIFLPMYLLLTFPVGEPPTGAPPRTWRRMIPTIAALVLGSVPVLWTYLRAPSESFASRYGQTGISPGDVLGGVLVAVLPFAPVVNGNRTQVLFVVGTLLLLLLIGWHVSLGPRNRGTRSRAILVPAVGLPIIGSLVYAPWPFYLLIYALPFVFGGALLIGQATSSLGSTRSGRTLAAFCLTIILSFSYMQAFNEAGRTRALHAAIATSVTRVADIANVDTVLVTVAPDQFDPRGNFGPRFWLVARALGLEWPPVRDVRCDDAPVVPPRGILVFRVGMMCPSPMRESERTSFPHTAFDWPDPRPRLDSVWVDLLLAPARVAP